MNGGLIGIGVISVCDCCPFGDCKVTTDEFADSILEEIMGQVGDLDYHAAAAAQAIIASGLKEYLAEADRGSIKD